MKRKMKFSLRGSVLLTVVVAVVGLFLSVPLLQSRKVAPKDYIETKRESLFI